jgi:hypothetical protein
MINLLSVPAVLDTKIGRSRIKRIAHVTINTDCHRRPNGHFTWFVLQTGLRNLLQASRACVSRDCHLCRDQYADHSAGHRTHETPPHVRLPRDAPVWTRAGSAANEEWGKASSIGISVSRPRLERPHSMACGGVGTDNNADRLFTRGLRKRWVDAMGLAEALLGL